MTAIVDAVFCIMLIGIAANVLVLTGGGGGNGDEVQEPGQVIERIFSGSMEYSDIGTEVEYEGTVGMNRIAYISLCKDDGRFMAYACGIVSEIYPWLDSYRLTISWSDGTETGGSGDGDAWMSAERTYYNGFSGYISVTLEVFR